MNPDSKISTADPGYIASSQTVRYLNNNIGWLEKINVSSLIQFAKYAFSGGVATLVHISIFFILAWKVFPSFQKNDLVVILFKLSVADVTDASRSINSILCNGIAFICSNMVAYIMNIYWVFEPGRHNKFIEIGLFYLVSGVSIGIGTFAMWFLISFFGIQTTYAFTVNIIFSVMINYTMRKFFIFKG